MIVKLLVMILIAVSSTSTSNISNDITEPTYIEDTSNTDVITEMDKVQSDIELCTNIKNAMEIARNDASRINEPDYDAPKKGDGGSIRSFYGYGGVIYMEVIRTYITAKYDGKYVEPFELTHEIKSELGKTEQNIEYYWVSDTEVLVYINNTDINGSTDTPHDVTDGQCIHAGPIELYGK